MVVREQIAILKEAKPEDAIKARLENENNLNAAFDEIFGTSDELERRCLMKIFDLEVEFKFIDQEHPDKKEAAELKAKKFLEINLKEDAEKKKE